MGDPIKIFRKSNRTKTETDDAYYLGSVQKNSPRSKLDSKQNNRNSVGSPRPFKLKIIVPKKQDETPRKSDLARPSSKKPLVVRNKIHSEVQFDNNELQLRQSYPLGADLKDSSTQNQLQDSTLLLRETNQSPLLEKKYSFFNEAQQNKNYGILMLNDSNTSSPTKRAKKDLFFEESPISVKIPKLASATQSPGLRRYQTDPLEHSLLGFRTDTAGQKIDSSPNSPFTFKVKKQFRSPLDSESKSPQRVFFPSVNLTDVIVKGIPSNQYPLSVTTRLRSLSYSKSELSMSVQRDIVNDLILSPIDTTSQPRNSGRFSSSRINEYGLIQLEDLGSLTDREVGASSTDIGRPSDSKSLFTQIDGQNPASPVKDMAKTLRKIRNEDEMVMFHDRKMPSKLALMPKLRKKFLSEVMAQERGQESYETPLVELLHDIEHQIVSQHTKVKDNKASVFNKKTHKKELQSKKVFQGAYYDFLSLSKNSQKRIRAKLEQIMPERSRFLKLNQP